MENQNNISKFKVLEELLRLSSNLTLNLLWILFSLFCLQFFLFLLFSIFLSIFRCFLSIFLLLFLSLSIDFRFFSNSSKFVYLLFSAILNVVEVIAKLNVGELFYEIFIFVEVRLALGKIGATVYNYSFPVNKS